MRRKSATWSLRACPAVESPSPRPHPPLWSPPPSASGRRAARSAPRFQQLQALKAELEQQRADAGQQDRVAVGDGGSKRGNEGFSS